MVKAKLLSFSPTGEKLAHCGPSGILRIWDTATGVLEHEYQPAEHLTATATCIRYSPTRSTETPKKAAKAKNSLADDKGSLLAMGTLAGNIILYCPEKSDIIATFKHSPPHAIVDVAWRSPHRLFSLSANNSLIEWDIASGKKIVCVDVTGGNTLCSVDNMICFGSRRIEVATLQRKKSEVKIKKGLTGHTSFVTQLLPLVSDAEHTKYIISVSEDDRFIHAWDLMNEDEEPASSFMVKGIINTLAVADSKDDTVVLAVTTRKGALVLFKQHLNGNSNKKPIKQTGKLQIINSDKSGIPIITSFFCNDIASSIIIVYGDSSVFKFEKMCISEISGDTEIIRTGPSNEVTRKETALLKTVTPKLTKDVTMVESNHLVIASGSETKRKRGDEDGVALLPMEERLNALALDKTTVQSGTHPPMANNLVHLLLQGLHSKDLRILQNVIDRGDEVTINNTVRRLPVSAVLPLLKHLQTVIMGRGYKNIAYVKWVRSVLYYHMSHLSSHPDREELMQPFYSASAARMSSLYQVTQLHARLDLMLTHVATRHEEAKQDAVEPEALLVYREESSDEDDLLEGTMGVSESEDNWEELSDIGEVNGHTDEDSDMEVDKHIASVKRKLEEEEEVLVNGSEEESDLIVDDYGDSDGD
ncbi:WD repeat-containing protein 43 [Panulirus ornatus]|uniref:WD repeat-containing protein 43 n=1 Tax=Panulirus ornatus TaxID=150431 RepID=UPI003A8BA05A